MISNSVVLSSGISNLLEYGEHAVFKGNIFDLCFLSYNEKF